MVISGRISNVEEHIADYISYKLAEEHKYTSVRCGVWNSSQHLEDVFENAVYHEVGRDRTYAVIKGLDAIARLRWVNGEFNLEVQAKDQSTAQKVIDTWKKKYPAALPERGSIQVQFWYHTPNGASSYSRKLMAPSWTDVLTNYPVATRASLDRLLITNPEQTDGKLILWQGEPGTGKTFALRSLAENWSSWCTLHYILDPENFFANGQYMLKVILGDGDESPSTFIDAQAPPKKNFQWRLVVLEDSGEMMAKDAKSRVGQGLSRLLNLCDGLLGQGLPVLVLITTNESMGALHDAVIRPGRCLSKTVFDKFSRSEARTWLATRNGPGPELESDNSYSGYTLAELYGIAKGSHLDADKKIKVGF